jgi:hypothetical protein
MNEKITTYVLFDLGAGQVYGEGKIPLLFQSFDRQGKTVIDTQRRISLGSL